MQLLLDKKKLVRVYSINVKTAKLFVEGLWASRNGGFYLTKVRFFLEILYIYIYIEYAEN